MKFSTTMAIVISATLAISFGQKEDLCTRLMKVCDMRIAGYMNRPGQFSISGIVNRAFTPKFVTGNHNGFIIGQVNSGSRAPDFIFKKKAVPITRFGFGPSAFKPFAKGNSSGVGRQQFTPGQLNFAKFRCVRVWFSYFQLHLPSGRLLNFQRIPPGATDCIVFRTK